MRASERRNVVNRLVVWIALGCIWLGSIAPGMGRGPSGGGRSGSYGRLGRGVYDIPGGRRFGIREPFETSPHVLLERYRATKFEPSKFLETRPKTDTPPLPPSGERWKELPLESIAQEPWAEIQGAHTDLLAATVGDPRFVVALPTGKAYEAAFGTTYSARTEGEVLAAKEKFESIDPDAIRILDTEGKAALLREVRRAKGSPLIIVAHSTGVGHGRILRFGDGSEISVKDILAAGLGEGTPCVIVSCRSSDLGVTGLMSLTTAYNMCLRASLARQAGLAPSADALVWFMRHEATQFVRPDIDVFLLIAASGITTLAICSFPGMASLDSLFRDARVPYRPEGEPEKEKGADWLGILVSLAFIGAVFVWVSRLSA